MSDKTGIQWTDATWNPIRGCSRVSAGCVHCYAEVVAARFSGPGQAYEGLARRTSKGEARWTGKIMFVAKHLLDPLRWKEPRRIFVNSMSDLFHRGVTDDELAAFFGVMAIAHHHTFQVLTKRPERMLEVAKTLTVADCIAGLGMLCEQRGVRLNYDRVNAHLKTYNHVWPLRNVWLGVSVENQATADERIPLLLDTPTVIRFLSCEPLLGSIDLIPFLYDEVEGTTMPDFSSPRASNRALSWVIVGGESGRKARSCDVQWIRDIVEQCRGAGVAPFVKQLGAEPGFKLEDEERRGNFAPSFHHSDGELFIKKLNDSHGGDPAEWPEDLRVREFPTAVAA